MMYLLIVSLIWAFSFPLIKMFLVGIDSSVVSFIRLGLSFLCFLPFLAQHVSFKTKLKLIALGAVQYGLMYFLYIQAYQHLKGYEVALFTITTPLWVVVCAQVIKQKRMLWSILTALLACMGAVVLVYNSNNSYALKQGFVLVQLANICFALGQVYYKHWWNQAEYKTIKQQHIFAYLFLGATLFNATLATFNQKLGQIVQITAVQWLTLIYLGVIASGLGFYLWNFGATKVKHAVLASFNNLKIPLSILVSIAVFSESGNLIKLLLGSSLIVAAIAFGQYKVKD